MNDTQARHYDEWMKYGKDADGNIVHGVMSRYMNCYVKKKAVSSVCRGLGVGPTRSGGGKPPYPTPPGLGGPQTPLPRAPGGWGGPRPLGPPRGGGGGGNGKREVQEASGWPRENMTEAEKDAFIAEYAQKEGIELDRDNIKKNAAGRTVAKLHANTLWG